MLFDKINKRLGLILGALAIIAVGGSSTALADWDPDSPPDPGEAVLQHKLVLESDPEGSCSFNYRSTTRINEGAQVWVEAYLANGFKFLNFTIGDSIVSYDPYYEFTMPTKDITLVAHTLFDPDNVPDPEVMPYQRKVRVTSYPAKVSGFNFTNQRFLQGQSVEIYAYPQTGFKINRWTVNGVEQSTKTSPLTVEIGEVGLDVVAYFEFDPENPANPNANYWDATSGTLVIDDFRQGNLWEAIYNRLQGVDYDEVRSIIVKGQMDGNDIGALREFRNVEEIDLSRVGGLTHIPGWGFELSNVSTLILPASVEYISYCAFYGCQNLSSLYVYSFAPPSVEEDTFYEFNNIDNCVLYVFSSSVPIYEQTEGWNQFTEIRPILDDVVSLQICLPEECSDGRYKNYRLELCNTVTQGTQKYVVTDRLSYSFNGMQEGDIYDAYLYTPNGIEIGSIKGIEIGTDNMSVTFENLKQVYGATASLMTLIGNVSKQATIEWYQMAVDGALTFLRKGVSITEVPSGTTLVCHFVLNQQLGMEYQTPRNQVVTIDNDNAEIVVDLQPLRTITLSGTVTDNANTPIKDASVSLTEVLNDMYDKSFTAITDRDGKWSITALESPEVQLIYSADEKMSFSQTCQIDNDANDLAVGTVVLKDIVGARLQYGFTHTPSVLDGVESEVESFYSDYKNVNVTGYNVTKGQDLEHLSVLYPQIVIMDENAEAGDDLRLVATSVNDAFDPVEVATKLDDNLAAKVTFPIVERGAIKSAIISAEPPQVMAYLYDANGNYVGKSQYEGSYAEFSDLQDGQYQLISIAKSDFFGPQLSIAAYDEMGLTRGSDYALSTVEVSKGNIVLSKVENVPAFNESKFFFTDAERSTLTTNKTSVSVGNYLTIRSQMNFLDRYAASIDNVKLVVDLPENCELIENSVLIGNSVAAYTLEDRRLIVPLGVLYRELVKFCVMPTTPGEFSACASVNFNYKNEIKTQPFGTATCQITSLDINIPALVAKTTLYATGKAPARSAVNVYEGTKLIGKATANAAGEWSAVCNLGNVYNLTHHSIHAEVTTPQGIMLKSDVRDCVYDVNAIQPNIVTMLHYNPEMRHTYKSEFNFMNPKTKATQWTVYYPEKLFTYTIDFTNNSPEIVKNVKLHVLTGGGDWLEYTPEYDKKLDLWVANIDMGNNPDGKYPVNVSLDYTSATESSIDTEQLKDLKLEIEEFVSSIVQDINRVDDEVAKVNCSVAEGQQPGYDALITIIENINGVVIPVSDQDIAEWSGMDDNNIAEYIAEISQEVSNQIDTRKADFSDLDNIFKEFAPIYNYMFNVNGRQGEVNISNADDIDVNNLINLGYNHIDATDGDGIYEYSDQNSYDKIDCGIGRRISVHYSDNLPEMSWDNAYGQLNGYIQTLIEQMLEKSTTLSDAYLLINNQKNLYQDYIDATEARLLSAYYAIKDNDNLDSTKREIISLLASLEHQRGYINRFTRASAKVNQLVYLVNDWIAWIKLVRAYGYRLDNLEIPDCAEVLQAEKDELLQRIQLLRAMYCNYYMMNILRQGEITLADLSTAEIIKYVLIFLEQRGDVVRDVQYTYHFLNELDSIEKTIRGIKNKCYAYLQQGSPGDYGSGCPDDDVQIDPSGYVYEGVEENRVQGVEATISYKETVTDIYGETSENIVVWNAEEYGQENPLYTDENGMYRWDVPQGLWQVKFEKDGYETAYSEWLPVPPPQLDVNVAIRQNTQPEVADVHAFDEGIEVVFNKYMNPASFANHIYVQTKGSIVTGQLVFDETAEFVKSLRYAYNEPLDASIDEVILTVTRDVTSYAGIPMITYVQSISIEKEVQSIAAPEDITMDRGARQKVEIVVGPVEAAAGKILNIASSSDEMLVVSEESIVLDADGYAAFIIQSQLPGTAYLTFSVDGSSLKQETKVVINNVAAKAMKGDVDNDNQITIADAVSTISYIIEESVANFDEEAADVNDSGDITVTDVALTVNLALDWDVSDNSNKVPVHTPNSDVDFIVQDLVIRSGETKELTIDITDQADFTAMQFDVTMPAGLTLDAANLIGDNADTHYVSLRKGSVARIMAYSLNNDNFASDQAVLNLTISADENLDPDNATISLTSGLAIIDDNGNISTYSINNSTVNAVADASGIADITNNRLVVKAVGHTLIIKSQNDLTVVLSDMMGRSRTLEIKSGINKFEIGTSGIYFVDGCKIAIK